MRTDLHKYTEGSERTDHFSLKTESKHHFLLANLESLKESFAIDFKVKNCQSVHNTIMHINGKFT